MKCITDLFRETLLKDRKSILEKSMLKENNIFFLEIEFIEREGWLIDKWGKSLDSLPQLGGTGGTVIKT